MNSEVAEAYILDALEEVRRRKEMPNQAHLLLSASWVEALLCATLTLIDLEIASGGLGIAACFVEDVLGGRVGDCT